MPRSLFSAYVDSGLQASPLLPSAFGDRAARKQAVARAAARTPSPALLAELEAQQAALPQGMSAARRRALETLARPGTAAVLTGQQVGLFLGPLYTIYKAATAVAVAETLALETGTPVVPIFWMATEDHDFAEIDHCTIARGSELPLRLRVSGDGRAEAREPVAETRLGADVSAAVEAVRDAHRRAPRRRRGRRRSWRRTIGRGAASPTRSPSCLASLFADEGLLVFHPRTPARGARWRRRSIGTALARAGEIAELLVARDARARRRRLRRRRCTCAPTRRWSSPTTSAAAASWCASTTRPRAPATSPRSRCAFSSSALLRPIVQDSLFPDGGLRRRPGRVQLPRPVRRALRSLRSAAAAGRAARALPPRRRAHPRRASTRSALCPPTSKQPMRDAARRASAARRPAPIAARRAARRHPRRPARRAGLAARAHRHRRSAAGARVQPHARHHRARRRAADRALRPHAGARATTSAPTRSHRARAVLFPDGEPQERVFAFPSFAAAAARARSSPEYWRRFSPFDPAVQDLDR